MGLSESTKSLKGFLNYNDRRLIHSGEQIFGGFTSEAKLVSMKLLIRAREGGGKGRGVLGYIGICRPIGLGFCAGLV